MKELCLLAAVAAPLVAQLPSPPGYGPMMQCGERSPDQQPPLVNHQHAGGQATLTTGPRRHLAVT